MVAKSKLDTPAEEISSELLELARAKGQRLGFLIAGLSVSDETKAALLALLPAMSLEQVTRLSEILEGQYLNSATADLDKQFREDLEKIRGDLAEKQKQLDQEAMAEIDGLTKQLS